MPFLRSNVVVRRVDADLWALEHDLTYEGRGQTFTVPAGFLTDFASVPRVVVWLIPKYGQFTLAAILHDWLCTVGVMTGAVSARAADGVFRQVMRELGIGFLQRWLMWAGVRWGAVFNRVRRPGVLRDMPLVLLLSLLGLLIVLPGVVGIVFGLALYTALCAITGGRRSERFVTQPARFAKGPVEGVSCPCRQIAIPVHRPTAVSALARDSAS